MCDMVTLGGKDSGLEPRNHCVYRRQDRQTDGQPDSSISPPPQLRCGGYKKMFVHGNLISSRLRSAEVVYTYNDCLIVNGAR
jgi:hypothetical protein